MELPVNQGRRRLECCAENMMMQSTSIHRQYGICLSPLIFANVESVTFNVKSQEGVIALKLGNDKIIGLQYTDDVEACFMVRMDRNNIRSFGKKDEGTFDKVVIMTTQNDASFCLTSVGCNVKRRKRSQITHGARNIIDNGDFSNQDFSSWSASNGEATITAETGWKMELILVLQHVVLLQDPKIRQNHMNVLHRTSRKT